MILLKLAEEGYHIALIWIPSHVGVSTENDRVDAIASGADSEAIRISDSHCYVRQAKSELKNEWQEGWTSGYTGAYLRSTMPEAGKRAW